MSIVRLTKRIEFAAAHRYYRPEWEEARNRAAFGACANPSGHGHNYLLEVTVSGGVDSCTGMVVNLYDLKAVLKQVLEEFDHKNLNLDTPYFQDAIPTTENIGWVLWNVLQRRREIGCLDRVRLYEDEDLYADVTGTPVKQATVTRRYHFSSTYGAEPDRRSRARVGRTYALHVSIAGEIDPGTGMVVDVPKLDRLVQTTVLERFDRSALDDDGEWASGGVTGERLVRLIWDLLVKAVPGGRLTRIALGETADLAYTCEER
jgi:6-pyruvoyltetrahydropterin/6-carboxytetrahydropterin synthase